MAYEESAHVRVIATLEDRLSKGLAGIGKNMSRLERHGSKAVSNLGRNLERGLVVGAVAGTYAFKEIVGAASDFQDKMAAVEKTLGAGSKTPENLKKIHDGLLDLSEVMPITAVELADIAKQAGQLGIESADDMLEFTELLGKLAKVTELDVTYAAENMGKLRTIFEMNADELNHFGQVLVALENSAASTVQDILNVSRRFAGAGQAAGLAADEVAAFASTITSLGILPEAGGSALSRIFQRTGVELANESKKAVRIAKFLKMDLDDAKKLYAEDATAFFMKFFKAVNKVVDSGTDLEKLNFKKILKDMGITNVRDIDAINKLGEGYAELVRQMDVAKGATTELDEAFESRSKSFAQQFQIFQNKLNRIAINIGEKIIPHLVTGMGILSDWIEEHSDEIDQFAEDVGKNFGKFIENIKPESISAFVGVLKTAVGFAQNLVDAFMGLPDWLKKLLVGIYVGNKLTGGVVLDVGGDLFKGAFNQFFARGATPANPLWVASVNGGVGGPGMPGGGKPPWWLLPAGVLTPALLVNGGGDAGPPGSRGAPMGQSAYIADLIKMFQQGRGQEVIHNAGKATTVVAELQRLGIDVNRIGTKIEDLPDNMKRRKVFQQQTQSKETLKRFQVIEQQGRSALSQERTNNAAVLQRFKDLEQQGRRTATVTEKGTGSASRHFKRLETKSQQQVTAATRLRELQRSRFMSLERETASGAGKVRRATNSVRASVEKVARKPTTFTVKNTNKATIFLTVDGKKLGAAVYTSTSTQRTTERSPYYSGPQFPH